MSKSKVQISGSVFSHQSWFNPFVLGLIPAIIILLLNPFTFNKYNIHQFYYRQIEKRLVQMFYDLEGDGLKELIGIGYNNVGNAAVYIHSGDNLSGGQHNLSRPLMMSSKKIKFFDFDNDTIQEIIVFTKEHDSLFLNVFSYSEMRFIVDNRYVTTIGGVNDLSDCRIGFLNENIDANNDGYPEFYFTVSAGFALYPRSVFRYDFTNDSIIHSINTGSNIDKLALSKINNNWSIVVFGGASGNCSPDFPYPYHDSCNWVFQYDKNLNLLKEPFGYSKYPSGTSILKDNKGRILFMKHSGYSKTIPELFSLEQGEVTKLRSTDFKDFILKDFWFQDCEIGLVIHRGDGLIYKFDKNSFETTYDKRLQTLKNKTILKQGYVLDEEMMTTFCFDYGNQQIELLDEKLKTQTAFPVQALRKVNEITWKHEEALTHILISADNGYYHFFTEKNKHYYWRFFVYGFVYIMFVLFIASILYYQKRKIEAHKKIENKLAFLQLQNLRNQLDPHFTFNALNSVGNAIYKENKQQAYDLFQRFTRMIRSSLLDSNRVLVSLNDELNFTRDYLELQKARFKDRFNYKLDVAEHIDLNEFKIPKMLIQSFAENAVKHAFYGIDYMGLIHIKVYDNHQRLTVIVDDNGIGIEQSKASKVTSGTCKGLKILEDQVKQTNKLYGTNFFFKIIDKKVQNKDTGTIIEIKL